MSPFKIWIQMISILFVIFISGCGADQGPEGASVAMQTEAVGVGFGGASKRNMMATDAAPGAMKMASDSAASGSEAVDSGVQDKKVIKNGSVSLQVNSLKQQAEAKDFVNAKAKEFSVNFDREDENRWGNQSTLSMTARVPAEQFDKFMEILLGGPFTVTNRSVYIEEVTDRYIDLDVRLKNKNKLREKYLALLNKADKTKDVLDINKNIESVTSDIESLEGQFRYLKKQISLSTLHITITAVLPETMNIQNGFFQDAGNALYTGVSRIRGFIIGLISLWPFIIMASIVVWCVCVWLQRRRLKK